MNNNRILVKANKTEDFLCKITYDGDNHIVDMDCTPMSEMCCRSAEVTNCGCGGGCNKSVCTRNGRKKVFKSGNQKK